MSNKEYTYDIGKYTIGVDENGKDEIGMTIVKIEKGEVYILGSCYGENARCIDLLIKENQELKEKYLNAVSDYETTMAEKNELKKQLEESNELVAQGTLTEMKLHNEVNRWRKEYQDTYKDVRIEIREYKTQQKEFIKWLEDNWKETQDIWYIKILQKYREIIGDDKNRN